MNLRATGAGLLMLGAVLLACVPAARAAEPATADSIQTRVRVFLDCDDCDEEFLHDELRFVDYVRDRTQADVHVLVTSQTTGSGGQDQTLTLIGLGRCAGLADTLHTQSGLTDTEDMLRHRLSHVLALGLARYSLRTGAAEGLQVTPVPGALFPADRAAAGDPWNAWVFAVSVNGSVYGQEVQKSVGVFGDFTADRVTEAAKQNWAISTSYNRQSYQLTTEKLVSTSSDYSLRGTVVASLGEHWSAGAFTRALHSSYDNVDLLLSLQPALEYDVYPYSASTRQTLRVLYHTGPRRYRYRELTVFDKLRETLWVESLDIALSRKEPWGSASVYLSGSHYWHDLRRNRAEISGNLSLRVSEGLSLQLNGNYSRVHDQLSLPRRDATDEEILLQRRALASGYYYSTTVGISYSFGSIFNNVVNPRFGS